MESTRTDSAAVGVTLKEQALWLLERLVPDIGVNNVPMTFRVDGRLSVAAVERTIALLMRRFETLRTVFYADETELRKRILGPDETTIPVQVIPTGPDEISALRDFVARPFELQSQPLVRAGIQHAADGDVCCVAVHHLIFDAVSAAILFMNFVAVGQLVVQTRDNFLSALKHASVSLDDFMADLSRSSSSWRDTIMRHMFNYMTGPPGQSFVIGGMKGEPVSIFNGFAKSDIEFFVNSAPDGISIRAVYYAELFDQDDVRLLVTRYETLLATLAADVKQPIGELPTWGERPAPTDDGTPPEPAAGYDSELVRELVGLWRQMLGRDDVDARSNFFVKGGHSVLAAQLAHKVGELTGVRPKLADVFAMPTPAELADLIDSRRRETAE